MLVTQHLVVNIVSGSYFQTTCSKLNIHIVVFYHLHLSVGNRHNKFFAFKVSSFRIIWVDTYSSVTKYSFGASCCYNSILTLFTHNGIAHIVQLAGNLFVNNLLVRKSSFGLWVPVYHPYTSIYETLVVKVCKHFQYTLRAFRVHSEASSIPVA